MRWSVFLLAAAAACAQPAFDVASVKPSPPATGGTYNFNLGTARNGEVTLSNATLADCIKFAYGMVGDDQLAGPEWIKSKDVRFEIQAKAPPSTSREQLLLMLQGLLNDRFRLILHTEARSFAHYVLSVGKAGPRMTEVQPDPATSRMSYRIGRITHTQIPMHTLALLLSRQMKALVLDGTGLGGAYEIDLHWTPEGSEIDNGPSIYTALQEQLGLRLEGRRDAVDVMVVDRADRIPEGN